MADLRGMWLMCAGVCVLASTATPASAGGKVKAHVECMSGLPLKSGKAVKLTNELWCSIKIDSLGGFKPDGLVAVITPRFGRNSTLRPEPGGVEVKLADTQDGVVAELANAWVVDKDYKACEPFEVYGSLHDAANRGMDDEVWAAPFKVAASCPKPKKVAGKLACHATAQDGTVFQWPGNGVKLKPRLESTLSCTISAPKSEAGVKYQVSLGIAGKGAPKQGDFDYDEARAPFFSAEFDESVYEACSSFTVTGAVTANGASLWSGKLAIKQSCPD